MYEERFKKVWEALLKNDEIKPEETFSIAIGAGTPNLAGVKVSATQTPKALFQLDFESSKPYNTYRFEWLKVFVSCEMSKLGIQGAACPAQLQAVWQRVLNGEKVNAWPIMAVHANPQADAAKAHSLVMNKSRKEIAITVYDIKAFGDQAKIDQLLASIEASAQKVFQGQGKIKVMRQELSAALLNAHKGVERLGIDMPFVQLAAVALAQQADAKAAPQAATAAAAPKQESYPGMGKLKFELSKDHMQAQISDFQLEWYEDPTFTVNGDWVRNEAKFSGIHYGIDEACMKKVIEAITTKEPLKGLVVAYGDPGEGAKGPYLHPVYKELPKVDQNAETVDIRSLQQKLFVNKGQLVAELRYSTAPKLGKDVTGKALPPKPPEAVQVAMTDGIEMKAPGKYYAMSDGVPVIDKDKHTIGLNRLFVHKGDVNLSTGNIVFKGAAEIQGAVDQGASVNVQGDLIIKGGIRGGRIICNGNVVVTGGITTGTTGLLRVNGDVKVDFIQNATIICGGTVSVNKAIIASKIIAGKSIEVLAGDGNVIGGSLSAKDLIKVANLGQNNAAVTEARAGADWKSELRVQIRQKRYDAVVKCEADDRQAIRELVRKNAAQMTARHEEMKQKLQERIAHAKRLTQVCKAALEKAQANFSYNMDARILVSGILSTNCRVMVSGVPIPMTNDVAGAAIVARKSGASNIMSIEEFEAKEKLANNSEKAEQKKAS
jgi:uncharacterized protein (DUF342 family)